MASTTRKPKALIDAEKKIIELEKQLISERSNKDIWYKNYNDQKELIDGFHDILDDLGIRGFRDENKYTRIPLPVRLFAWAMSLNTKGKE
jgi:hypothetical protein